MRASLPLPSAGREMLRRLLYLKVSTQASLAVHTAKKEVRHARKHHVVQGICPGARDDGTADCAGTGSDGPAQCVAAGGRCVIGPPTNCVGMIGSEDCNPDRNPGGAIGLVRAWIPQNSGTTNSHASSSFSDCLMGFTRVSAMPLSWRAPTARYGPTRRA